MPNYDYACERCAHQEEVFQKITEAPLQVCPKCKQSTFRRQISGGNTLLRFKGSGFYITDYCQKESETNASPKSSGCGCHGTHSC